jgi:hypothetical protein
VIGAAAWRRLAAALLLAAVVGPLAGSLAAQAPNLDWRTIKTRHFYIHVTPPIEGLARRVAADAERAYGELSNELHPPRGMIDVVVSDDYDFSNGSATPFPTNRIVIYANPPVFESALRYTNDWARLVITHELTHIFHLDRSRGVWAFGQHIFGRPAVLFPNNYAPSWLAEGLAVYEESRLTGVGRIEGSEHRMIARAAAIDHSFPSIGALSLAQGRYPFGETAYSYGSLFIDYIARTRGPQHVRDFVEKSSADIIPYLIDIPARQGFGISFSRAWTEFRDSVARTIRVSPDDPARGWRELTKDGVYVLSPRWLDASSVVYSGTPGRESYGAYRVDVDGRRTRIGRRNGRSANVAIGKDELLFSQLDFVNPYQERSDLWIQRRGSERQITFGQRLTTPDARAGDARIVATQIVAGGTRLVLVSRNGKTIKPITNGSYDEQWTEPRWSHDGKHIAAAHWLRGNVSQIVVVDSTGHIERTISSSHSIEATPSWASDDSGLFYSSDRTGEAQIYFRRFDQPNEYVVSSASTGLFEPQLSPDGARLAAVHFRADGFHLGVFPCCDAAAAQWSSVSPQHAESSEESAAIDSTRARKYSPWRTFIPHYWLPTADEGIDGGYRIGAITSGFDVVGRHSINATVEVPTNNRGGIVGHGTYRYSGLGLPVLQLDASQDWQSLGGAFARNSTHDLLGEVFRRTWNAEALATWVHQRVRTAYAVTGGVGVEHRTHTTTADVPLTSLDTAGAFGSPTFPSLIASASFGNLQFPPFAISPEDGVQLGVTVRDRMKTGQAALGGASYSTVGTLSAFKSLDFPGFAHHVLAFHGSAGYSDERAAGYYSVGGISGGTIQIVPGYVLGEGARTFPVRGFTPGTLIGTRAITGSAEYRLPLFMFERAPGPLPLFFDRSSITLFGDYGSAWCPDVRAGREVCNTSTDPNLTRRLSIGSVGGELNLNLAPLSWDVPYRFRLGVAVPMQNASYFGRTGAQLYFVTGVGF